MASPAPPSPSDNRFALVTPDDHQAYVYIAAILSLIWSSITLVIKLFTKWGCYGADDALTTVAQIICFGQYTAVFVALKNSLGKNISSPNGIDRSSLAKATVASQIIMIIVVALCQSSVLLLIQRIFAKHSSKRSMIRYLAGQGVIALWGLSSVLAILVRCSPYHLLPGKENSRCSGDVLRWKVITIFEAIIELALVVLPAYLVSRVHMKLDQKVLVVVAFAFKLPTAGFFIAQLFAYADSAHHGYTGVILSKPIIWQQVVVGYSLTATTIPTLKAFLKGFTTGGMGYTSEAIVGSTAAGDSKGSGIHSGRGDQQPISTSSGLDRRMHLRPDVADYSANVISNDNQGEDASMMSEGSQELIIRKNVDWDVRRN